MYCLTQAWDREGQVTLNGINRAHEVPCPNLDCLICMVLSTLTHSATKGILEEVTKAQGSLKYRAQGMDPICPWIRGVLGSEVV